MILTVAGHRPDKLGGYRTPNTVYNAVIREIDTWLMTLSPSRVISGMALGVDQWACELCLANDIPYTAAVPFMGYDSQWPPEAQRHYRELLSRAAEVHYVSTTNIYSPDLLHERNRWMVSQSDALLVIRRPDDHQERGTDSTIDYARRRNKQIYRVELPSQIWDLARHEELLIEQRRAARQGAGIDRRGRPVQINQGPPPVSRREPPPVPEAITFIPIEPTVGRGMTNGEQVRAAMQQIMTSLQIPEDEFHRLALGPQRALESMGTPATKASRVKTAKDEGEKPAQQDTYRRVIDID